MTYSNWQLRKTVMAEPTFKVVDKFHGLVVVDSVDWNTGIKKFVSNVHWTNWLKMLAERNGLNPQDLANAVYALVEAGYATYENETLTLVSDVG